MLKKLYPFYIVQKQLKRQSCTNTNCNRPIKLEPDGSPPQFCAGCGLLLSTSLAEIWSKCADCCELCGKIKDSNDHFCSRCGAYLARGKTTLTLLASSLGLHYLCLLLVWPSLSVNALTTTHFDLCVFFYNVSLQCKF